MSQICLITRHLRVVAMNGDSALGPLEGQFIGDADGLQQGAKLVIPVRAFTQNFKRPVYFGEGRKSQCHCASLSLPLSRAISPASTEYSSAFSHCLRASVRRPASRRTSPRCSWMAEFLLE